MKKQSNRRRKIFIDELQYRLLAVNVLYFFAILLDEPGRGDLPESSPHPGNPAGCPAPSGGSVTVEES